VNKKITIKKIDTFSLVRLTAIMGLILGFLALLFMGFQILSGVYVNPLATLGATLVNILLLELYIVMICAIYCWSYNVMAAKFGGIKIEVSED
jgi:hypothetical protein